MTFPPRAVLFDLDGTLTNTVPLIAKHIAQVLAAHGTFIDPVQVHPYIGQPLATAWMGLAGIAPDDPQSEELGAQYRASVKGDIETAGEALVLPGAKALLGALHDGGAKVAVVTAKTSDQARHLLHHAGLGDAVDVLVGTDDVVHGKPAPDSALLGAQRLGVPPSECIYVGDAATDVLMAVAAGMPCYGVTTGASDAQQLGEAGAVAVVESLDELLTLLRG